MTEKPSSPPTPATKRRRGRPPKPGGPIPQAEMQRAYRARLAAAGKGRLGDVRAPVPPSIHDFDPARDGVYERKMFEDMRDRLHASELKVERQAETIKRLEQRNAFLETELKTQERHITDALKANVVLQQKLAERR